MAYLLDTNHCFLLIARAPRVIAAMATRGAEQFMTSVIAAGELRYGAAVSERKIENVQAVEEFLARIDQVSISPTTARHYADLKSRLLVEFGPRDRARRRSFDLTTLGFTASAIEHGAILLTSDSDYGRMGEVSDLVVENWLA